MTHAVDLQDAPDRLQELPPSAKLAYLVLQACEPADRWEVGDRSQLPQRTVGAALHRLEDAGLVEARPVAGDARRREYHVTSTR